MRLPLVEDYALVILDPLLPEMNGLAGLQDASKRWSHNMRVGAGSVAAGRDTRRRWRVAQDSSIGMAGRPKAAA